MNFPEIMAVIAVITALMAFATPSLTRIIQQTKAYKTRTAEESVAQAVSDWYRNNAFTLDSTADGSTLSFPGGSFRLPSASEFKFQKLNPDVILVPYMQPSQVMCLGGNFPYLDVSDLGYGDAWQDCYLLYVTPQQEAPDGVKFRDFYIVSAGENRRIDFDGNNTGDDIVKLISGYAVEKRLLKETREKLQKIKESLENYFYSLYTNDPSRDPTTDYFLREKTDGELLTNATIMGNSCTVASEDPFSGECLVPISEIAADADGDGNPDTDALLDVLGLTAEDLTDAWGNEILIDTASAHVRSPETGKSSPYTCRVVSFTPWGEAVEVTARQKF